MIKMVSNTSMPSKQLHLQIKYVSIKIEDLTPMQDKKEINCLHYNKIVYTN